MFFVEVTMFHTFCFLDTIIPHVTDRTHITFCADPGPNFVMIKVLIFKNYIIINNKRFKVPRDIQ